MLLRSPKFERNWILYSIIVQWFKCILVLMNREMQIICPIYKISIYKVFHKCDYISSLIFFSIYIFYIYVNFLQNSMNSLLQKLHRQYLLMHSTFTYLNILYTTWKQKFINYVTKWVNIWKHFIRSQVLKMSSAVIPVKLYIYSYLLIICLLLWETFNVLLTSLSTLTICSL